MPKNDSLIGRQLANFRIERLLGRGGMATVYAGQDVKLQRPVAIKIIDARYQDGVLEVRVETDKRDEPRETRVEVG